MNEEPYRKKAEESIETSVKEIAQTFQEYPYFFVSEEDIRCMLYGRVSLNYPKPIYYKKKPNSKVFRSSAVHANPYLTIKEKNEKLKKSSLPDLLLYYTRNNEKNPILTTHKISRSKTNPYDKYKRKVWFFPTNSQAGDCIDERIIVEIKLNKKFSEINKKESIRKDINKVKKWDFWKCYILFFDRSNTLDDDPDFKSEIIGYTKKDSNKIGGNIEFIYVGYSSDGNREGQCLHFKNGDIHKLSI